MFDPVSYNHMSPTGDPSPEALHREDFMNEKSPEVEAEAPTDPALVRFATLLRARTVASVGRFFA